MSYKNSKWQQNHKFPPGRTSEQSVPGWLQDLEFEIPSRPGSVKGLRVSTKFGNFGSMLGKKKKHFETFREFWSLFFGDQILTPSLLGKTFQSFCPFAGMTGKVKTFTNVKSCHFFCFVPSTQKRLIKHLPTADILQHLWQRSNCWEVTSVFQNHGMGWEGP